MKGTSGDFVLLRTEPPNNGKLFLNEAIRVDFSNPVDLTSADLSSITFTVLDVTGKALQEQPAGTFQLAASTGDEVVGRRLEFVPRFPTADTYDDGGFRPARTYVVQIPSGDRRNGTVLRDKNGKTLRQAVSFQFSTADGTTPSQLFRDTKVGGPRRTSFTVTPSDTRGVALNMLGQAGVEIRLGFDQPLDPASTNVPHKFNTNPVARRSTDRGKIFLLYDDPDARDTWIPTAVEIESNTLQGSMVVLRPLGVLPNNATIRVIVENTLADMAGESNVADAAFNRVFGEFTTRQDYQPQFDAVVENFDSAAKIDLEAAFVEPVAELKNGVVKSSFGFEGNPTVLEYEPNTSEVILNTDFTQITPRGAPPINVSGGVFEFRRVVIPQNVTVRGTGTRPMVWLVTGDFIVRGEITLTGGTGARVDTLNSANFPTPGGVGVCGGGNGGRGSPSATSQDLTGEAGYGPNQAPGGGGAGGLLSDNTACNRGSGGGGGSMATRGDPWYKVKAAGTGFKQQVGVGGQGCLGASGAATRRLNGGEPGPLVFKDARNDNNFWGSAINLNRPIRITGELLAPIGGAGGGGGGDNSTQLNNPNWIQDNKGGGGGAGGGVLIIKALGKIIIEPRGIIRADGGHGGGGEAAGGNTQGGGGGAGSGGHVILISAKGIDIYTHGETYGSNDYVFAVSADGGIGTQGRYGGTEFITKYPPPSAGSVWDANPAGAFGGMGVVQLMVPPGTNSDGTNTVLDDKIRILDAGGNEVNATNKKRYIAWRGLPNVNGQFADDEGVAINLGDLDGDIRPSPILMPSPVAGSTRMRSKWIDTGSSFRRPLTASDGAPRGVVEDPANNLKSGPTYFFDGTNIDPDVGDIGFRGYIAYEDDNQGGVRQKVPAPVVSGTVLSLSASASFEGAAAYTVELTEPRLGSIANQYAHYQCLLINVGGSTIGEFRILGHTDRRLFLSPEGGALPQIPSGGLRASVVPKFFEVATNGGVSIGGSRLVGNHSVPYANTRIGFAFHKNPSIVATGNTDPNRYPTSKNEWLYDLNSPAVREDLRNRHLTFVQWDLLFNSQFTENRTVSNIDDSVPISPDSPRQELRFLRIPYRF